MRIKSLKNVVIKENSSIKDAMRCIDHSGLRMAYIIDVNGKLAGVVSDSEIRKAILKGIDIKTKVKDIINPKPLVLKDKDLQNLSYIKKVVRDLLEKMPDSRYIMILDAQSRPKRLALISDLLEGRSSRKHNKSNGRSVLVVGGAGYLGSVLCRKLLAKGYKVNILDLLLFGSVSVKELKKHQNFNLIKGDMRNISTLIRALDGIDAVINLAAIVGDPACKNIPEAAIETNYLANKALAEACKYNQVNRFIYASTCSVYGTMDGNKELDEDSPLNPVSLYARSKIHSEEGILSLEDENFAPIILRMGTLYGYSQRMRFDLVVNTMTKNAVVDGKIFVHGGGKQWRPLLHVEDAAGAYVKCLEAPLREIKGEIFNVGSNDQNCQILEISKIVKKCIPHAKLRIEGESTDPRNYFVSFLKIKETLGFRTRFNLEKAVLRIKRAIDEKEIKDVNDPRYYNVEYNQ